MEPTRQSILTLTGLEAGYGKKPVLRGINLAVQRGEIVALLGGNGAGKSTLLKSVAGLLAATGGQIIVRERDVTAVAANKRMQQGISYLLQGGKVFPSMTVAENLALATECTGRKASAEIAYEIFPELRKHRRRRGGLLSGGQRQALAVGMVMAQLPDVLLLDEPTAGLSPTVLARMLDAIATFRHEHGAAVLLVEQRVREALGLADRAILLGAGRVVSQTDHPSSWLESRELQRLFIPKKVEQELDPQRTVATRTDEQAHGRDINAPQRQCRSSSDQKRNSTDGSRHRLRFGLRQVS